MSDSSGDREYRGHSNIGQVYENLSQLQRILDEAKDNIATGPVLVGLEDGEEPPENYMTTEIDGRRYAIRPLTTGEAGYDRR